MFLLSKLSSYILKNYQNSTERLGNMGKTRKNKKKEKKQYSLTLYYKRILKILVFIIYKML